MHGTTYGTVSSFVYVFAAYDEYPAIYLGSVPSPWQRVDDYACEPLRAMLLKPPRPMQPPSTYG